MLMAAVAAAWSASLVRTTIFLGVLSAAGVALGFAAQGGVGGAAFNALALVVLPLLLFLGVATFIRLVQLQRESLVYITGMNRIRHYFQQTVPHLRPYFVLRLAALAPALDAGQELQHQSIETVGFLQVDHVGHALEFLQPSPADRAREMT